MNASGNRQENQDLERKQEYLKRRFCKCSKNQLIRIINV